MAKQKRKTLTEATEEAKQLREMKPRVKQFSGFGDDHHQAIDAQIIVLDNLYTDDEIFDDYGENTDDFKQNVLDAALDAKRWLDGDYSDAPSLADSWKDLVK